MPKKKPYFPNHADLYRKLPEEVFRDPNGDLLTFEEFMDMKFIGPLLPVGILCIIREHKANGKVKEHVYRYRHAAQKKCRKLIYEGNKEITVVQQDAVHFIDPNLHDIFN